MNTLTTLRINLRKLQTYKQKAVFLILPIILLMTLSIIITSETANFQKAAEDSIFGTISQANQLIELTKNDLTSRFSVSGGPRAASGAVMVQRLDGGGSSDDQFTRTDLDKVLSIPNVTGANIVSPVPLSGVKAVGVFDTNYVINQLATIDTTIAAQYTDQNFTYVEGEPIPIIVNANDFIERYEDWQGKDSISIDFSQQQRGAAPGDDFPVKTQAISYTKSDLIGKEFTLQTGGLSDLETFTTEPSTSGITFKKYTQAELDQHEQDRKANISPFWNYGEIKKPLEYKFKIVGVIEDASSFYNFIPQEAANKLMSDLISHQLNSRSSNALSNADLDSKFQGLTWDGLELRYSGISGLGGVGGGTRIRFSPMGGVDSSANYTIPGLVVQIDRSNNEVKGAYTDPNVYTQAAHSGTTMLVKVDSISNRSDVVKALNAAGFAYQDTTKLGVISELKATLSSIVLAVAAGFVLISIMVIILTMGKFVSESKREIGVLRALGATRGEIRTMFLSQSILYVLFGYIAGAAIGMGAVIALTSTMHGAFDSFIGKTLKESFAVVNPVSSEVFTAINWELFAVFSLALLAITVITSLIPATTAAKVSPVEAIRGE